MKTMLNLLVVSILTVSVGNLLAATNDADFESAEKVKAERKIEKALIALDNVMEDPEQSIPQSLINQSEGIVIFPGAFKVAVGMVGGQGGRGVALVRQEDGSWSNPFFVSLGEGSLGFQIGVQSSEIVLLFKNREDILEIDESEFNLGGDVAVAAGPASRGTSSSTDIKFEREIYSYFSSKGLFAGVSLNGAVLTYNDTYSDALYDRYDVERDEILNMIETPYCDEVNDLIQALNSYSE